MVELSNEIIALSDEIDNIGKAIENKNPNFDSNSPLLTWGQAIEAIAKIETLDETKPIITYLFTDENHEEQVVKRNFKVGENGTYIDIPTYIPQNGLKPALVLQEWNWTLTELQNVRNDKCIGATYMPETKHTYLLITCSEFSGTDIDDALNNVLNITKSTSTVLKVKIYDLKGHLQEFNTTEVNPTIPFRLPYYGDFCVEIWIETIENATIILGQSTTDNDILGTATAKKNMITEIYLGKDISVSKNFCIYNIHSLKTITIPNTIPITSAFNYQLTNLGTLKNITIPNGKYSFGAGFMQNCYMIKNISLSGNLYYLVNFIFQNDYLLRSVTIPKNYTGNIGNQALSIAMTFDYIFERLTPPSISATFWQNFGANIWVYVPDESLSLYRNATNWNLHPERIRPFSERWKPEEN